MEESILSSIKVMLGILEADQAFDAELTSHINSSISDLTQIAVGPDEGYVITGYKEVWSDFVDSAQQMSAAKEYIFASVRLVFDPPSNSFLCDALNKRKDESFWRLSIMADQARGGLL